MGKALVDLPSIPTSSSVLQDATLLEELMADAAEAQKELKSKLAPGTEWSQQAFGSKISALTGTQEARTLVVAEDADSVLRGGTAYDPGVAPEAVVHTVVASTLWHDDALGFRQVTDVSRLIVTFGSAKQLLE